jgi:hypothetical protein
MPNPQKYRHYWPPHLLRDSLSTTMASSSEASARSARSSHDDVDYFPEEIEIGVDEGFCGKKGDKWTLT